MSHMSHIFMEWTYRRTRVYQDDQLVMEWANAPDEVRFGVWCWLHRFYAFNHEAVVDQLIQGETVRLEFNPHWTRTNTPVYTCVD